MDVSKKTASVPIYVLRSGISYNFIMIRKVLRFPSVDGTLNSTPARDSAY